MLGTSRGPRARRPSPDVKRFLKEHGLSITMFGLFLAALVPMSITGHHAYNSDQRDHHQPAITYTAYLSSGDFIEGVFENWESEFLQMGTYVLFTVWLFQKGSQESKPIDEEAPQDADPRRARNPDRPRPVKKGGIVLKLYENSLAIALFALFVMSFLLHAAGGVRAFNQQQLEHGGSVISYWRFFTTSEFWYQSFQNWQSEFLAVGSLAVLGIFLRQRGSPESKPVAASHSDTSD
jgi:hypothetical protein